MATTKRNAVLRWFIREINKIYIVGLFLVIVLDILAIRSSSATRNDTNTIVATSIIAVLSIIYLIEGFFLLRAKILKDYSKSLARELEKAYFHGFSVMRYIETNAFLRLEQWLGDGLCYELSALAMVIMKNYKTTRICQGDYRDKDGILKTRHAWVEIKVPLNGWYVVDFAWFCPGVNKKKDYYSRLTDDGSKLVCKWVCTHEEFWTNPFPEAIRRVIQNTKKSQILLELSFFHSPDGKYGFNNSIMNQDKLVFTDGSYMFPCHTTGTFKPVSNEIIRDFVKNPRRRSPKLRSIRHAG